MKYFIYSNDFYLIQEKIKKIVKKSFNKEEFEYRTFSLIDDDIDNIYNFLINFNIFSEKRIIVINDCFFANESKTSLNSNFNIKKIETLLNYIDDEQTILFFVLNSDKISERLKITKLIKEKCKVYKLDELNYNQIKKLSINYFNKKNINIDSADFDKLFCNAEYDFSMLKNELKKIEFSNTTNINELKEIIYKKRNVNVFELLESFLENKVDYFFDNIDVYLNDNDLISFLSLFISVIINNRDILIYKEMGYCSKNTAQELSMNFYQVNKMFSKNYKINELNDKIKLLTKLYKDVFVGNSNSKTIIKYKFLKQMR